MPIGDRPPETGSLRFARIYPNPSGTGSAIQFVMPRDGRVVLRVFDVAGRFVATLVDERRSPGLQVVRWNGRKADGTRAASGVYFLRLEFQGRARTAKLVVVQ